MPCGPWCLQWTRWKFRLKKWDKHHDKNSQFYKLSIITNSMSKWKILQKARVQTLNSKYPTRETFSWHHVGSTLLIKVLVSCSIGSVWTSNITRCLSLQKRKNRSVQEKTNPSFPIILDNWIFNKKCPGKTKSPHSNYIKWLNF